MFDIQIAEGASAGNAVGRSPVAGRSDVRGVVDSHKYSYFTATTELNNNTLH